MAQKATPPEVQLRLQMSWETSTASFVMLPFDTCGSYTGVGGHFSPSFRVIHFRIIQLQ